MDIERDAVPRTEFGEPAAASLADILRRRAARTPDRPAATFIDDLGAASSLTYQGLLAQAQGIADELRTRGPIGSRALLLFPPGLEFLTAFFGCSLAGWVPVPTCFPRPGRAMPRLDGIAADCGPAILLSTRDTLESADTSRWASAAASVPRLAVDDFVPSALNSSVDQQQSHDEAASDDVPLALLQYTSGSTSQPKGVMVTSENLLNNLEAIRQGFGLSFVPDDASDVPTSVFWLPPFHDMGLIGGLLSPLYIGMHTVVFSPRAFLRRPLRWLETVSEYGATVTGAPNFAYQLCVDRVDPVQAERVNLRSLRVAFCGAEPIRIQSLEQFAARFSHLGFRSEMLLPCYGLAEATLFVAGRPRGDEALALKVSRERLRSGAVQVLENSQPANPAQRIASCGTPARRTEIAIVDPERLEVLAEDRIGEIWIRGASVARGYWPGGGSDDDSEARFRAKPSGSSDDSEGYLRTGDLGFLHDGRLYVTGRIKEMIILRGRNHYPQDIEATVRVSLEDACGSVAAFATDGATGEGLAVVVETPRQIDETMMSEWVRRIRRHTIEEHEVDPRHILLVRPGAIPLTTSGKVMRSAVKQQFETDPFPARMRWDRSSAREDGPPIRLPELPTGRAKGCRPGENQDQLAAGIEQWLVDWLLVRAGVPQAEMDPEKPFTDFGLDSLSSIEMSAEIEDWLGVQLTPVAAFEHPTPRSLARHLAELTSQSASFSPGLSTESGRE